MKYTIVIGLAIAWAGSVGALVACSSSGASSGFSNPDGSAGGGGGGSLGGGDSGEISFGGDASNVVDGGAGNNTSGDCGANLTARVRDFVNKPGFTPSSALDEDFENETNDDRGIVLTDLGSDLKPVYGNHPNGTTTTHGKTLFDYWYRDTSGINIPIDYVVKLSPVAGSPGVQTFNQEYFFPIDGQGWNDNYKGDDGKQHNFSFTFELHTTFQYSGGEVFTFIGDDDVFVFINSKLVVDLGGVHGAEMMSVNLDSLKTDDSAKTAVPLVKGATYPLDIFENERHTTGSHFRMDTTIVFNNCNPIIVR
jgi:fibro-slime domain-containing protein